MTDQRNYSPMVVARQIAEPDEQPITVAELDTMFLHLLRCPAVFSEAVTMLNSSHFERTVEPHYMILWSAMCELHQLYGQYTYETLVTTIVSRLQADPSCMLDRDRDALLRSDSEGIIWSSLRCPEQELIPDFGRDLLRKFLRERAVVRPLKAIMNRNAGPGYIQSFAEVLRAANDDIQRIETLRQAPISGVMPRRGDPLPPPIEYTPTGIGFIDTFIRGQRVGDCNGILGVFGSGKTTLGIQLAVQNGRNYYKEHQETGKRPKISVFLSYEEPETKVQPRVWSNAAMLPRDKVENLRWEDLTTQANLAQYEIQLAGDAARDGGYVHSESERWDITCNWLNTSFVLFDMSGSEKYPAAGSGYVDEVVAGLERIARERNADIGSVVIDYAGIMAKRHMQLKNISEDKLRHYIGGLGDALRRRVAEHFQATTWLLHQFNPEQNKRSPTTLLHHMDASESKSFAENLAVCGCLGTKDEATGCILMNWSKVRYYVNRSQSKPTLQIDGRFCRMIDVSDRFVPDAISRTFTDPNSMTNIEGTQRGPVSQGPPGRRPTVDLVGLNVEL